MSVGRAAAHGALWTVGAGLASRAIGVLGTVALTHFLRPDDLGPVAVASIVAMTVNWLTTWGFGQYLIVKGQDESRRSSVIFHVAVAYMVLGLVGLGGLSLLGDFIAPLVGSPEAAMFIPGMALAWGIRRISAVPEKVLALDLRFRPIAMSSAVGEVVYSVVTLVAVIRGHGAMSVIIGNIAQSLALLWLMSRAAGHRKWLTPQPLERARFAEMTRYGIPLCIEGIAHNGARYWDNLLMAKLFTAGPMAAYNMAYNLADIPAIHVGEQIGAVLLPSFAKLPPEARPAAFARACGLLGLIIFPMAMGLGAVAYPLIYAVMSPEWYEVAPLLMILAVLSVVRPLSWMISTYLEAQLATRALIVVEFGKLALLLGGIVALSPWGIEAAAASVGITYTLAGVLGLRILQRKGVPASPVIKRLARPLVAALTMFLIVYGVEFGLRSLLGPLPLLIVCVGLGVVSYVGLAFLVCRDQTRDLLDILKQVRKNRQ